MKHMKQLITVALSLALGAALGLIMLVAPAQAACSDPARPKVDWRRCYLDERVFKNVDLSGAKLRGSRFSRADLSGVNLSKADAHRVKFLTAKLKGVNFDGARLTEADFTKADLSGASFVGADLRRARLFRADLRGANLTNAKMTDADMLNADLSGATWTDGKTICAEGSLGQCN